ncbi:MAG: type 4a pilus biogenesis protein PilO [candidate division NC10 bacterium]|jgi:type IV pilus assembly protein PilO
MALPAFFDPIVNAPKPQKIVLGVVGLAIIGAAAYFLLLSPLETKVAQLRTQAASLEREVVQNRAIVADLARFRREVLELEARIGALKERLPIEREMPALYRTLSDAGTQAGLAVSLFQPRDAQIKDYYAEIPIVINADASYHRIGEFFERVARLARVVTVKDIKLSAGGRPANPVRAELTLATYQYRPVGSPKPGPQR